MTVCNCGTSTPELASHLAPEPRMVWPAYGLNPPSHLIGNAMLKAFFSIVLTTASLLTV